LSQEANWGLKLTVHRVVEKSRYRELGCISLCCACHGKAHSKAHKVATRREARQYLAHVRKGGDPACYAGAPWAPHRRWRRRVARG
jgi:hypothetical protein